MERKSVWAVSACFEYWRKNLMFHESRFQYFYVVLIDSVCYTQTLCALNIDANPEDCRQVVHVSQIQILVFCMVTSNCVCHTQIGELGGMEGLEHGGDLMIFRVKLKKFQDFETNERFRNGLGGLWAHSLAPRGNQTRLVESWSAQMSSHGSTEDRQKVAKVPPRP